MTSVNPKSRVISAGFLFDGRGRSIRDARVYLEDGRVAALIGADVATAPPAVIKAMANHVLTDKGLEGFLKDWEKTGQKILV